MPRGLAEPAGSVWLMEKGREFRRTPTQPHPDPIPPQRGCGAAGIRFSQKAGALSWNRLPGGSEELLPFPWNLRFPGKLGFQRRSSAPAAPTGRGSFSRRLPAAEGSSLLLLLAGKKPHFPAFRDVIPDFLAGIGMGGCWEGPDLPWGRLGMSPVQMNPKHAALAFYSQIFLLDHAAH